MALPWRRALGLLALVRAVSTSPASPTNTSVMLSRCTSPAGFTPPSPDVGNASVSAAGVTVPWSGLPFLNLSYDYAGGGWVASVGSDFEPGALDIPAPLALFFSVYNPLSAYTQLNIELQDANYKGVGTWPAVAQGWTNFTLPFTPSEWLPAANLSFPLRSLSIGVNRVNNARSWIGIADVGIVSGAGPGNIPRPVLLNVVNAAPETLGVVVAGGGAGIVRVGAQITNRLATPCTVDATTYWQNSTGAMGMPRGANDMNGTWGVVCATATGSPLLGFESRDLVCDVDSGSAPAGFFVWRALLVSASCWTSNDSAVMLEGGLAIVLPQPAITPVARNRNAGVFGGQMEGNAASVMVIGMRSSRSGPLWRWNQWGDCWNLSTCFSWSDYDGILRLAEAGSEVMIDARPEMAPPWAAAKNDSGQTWAYLCGEDHYEDYARWLSIVLDRYGAHATAVEVSNEDDGLSFFGNPNLPWDYMVNFSLAAVKFTAQGIAASANGSGLALVGLSSSMFDVKQEGNGGSTYMQFEREFLNAPGVLSSLSSTSPHPYAQQVWVPWQNPGWGNESFLYFNETLPAPASNSSTACLLAVADEMAAAAARQGLANYTPVLTPSEWGYNLLMAESATSGWPWIHAALVAQGLVHLRSFPLARFVSKAYYFAAYDGCCEESGGFFGLWRPQQMRTGADAASAPFAPSAPTNLEGIVPLPSVSAYATASALIDVPSGRAAGVFVVDHSAGTGGAPGPKPPSCVAFAPAAAGSALPLISLFILGKHFNDFTPATLTVATAQALGALSLLNGVGTPLALAAAPAPGGGYRISLDITALPQYLVLPADADATAACASLEWT